MTAHQFFLPRGVLAGASAADEVVLDGSEGRHAATVMRIAPGETVRLSDQEGGLASGEVVAAGKDTLTVRLAEVTRHEAPRLRLVLVQALAKGDRDELAVETATELGVDAVVPWQAQRSIVQWRGERGEKARRRWESTALAAAKQSRRALVPVVEPLVDGAGLVARAARAARVLVLHEEARTGLGTVDLPEAGDVLLVVGPEGGITPAELDALGATGAVPVRLGPLVLRASTAGPAALAAISAGIRW